MSHQTNYKEKIESLGFEMNHSFLEPPAITSQQASAYLQKLQDFSLDHMQNSALKS
jgi:hypothetical protein